MALPRILTVDSNNTIVLDEVILTVPEFRKLWEHTGDIMLFQFIWATCDPESPYTNLDEMDKEEMILKDFPVHAYLNEIEMVEAMEKAEKMYNSPGRKILKGTKVAIEKLIQYFDTMEIESGRDGNIAQIKSAIIDMPKMIKSYNEAESTYKQEVEKNRGGVATAIDDDYIADYD